MGNSCRNDVRAGPGTIFRKKSVFCDGKPLKALEEICRL